MRSNTVNYFAVGAFVIAMLVALVVVVAVLTGRTGATDTYHTRYEDVGGLKYGTEVLYMGFPVGQVEDIAPHPRDDGRVEFEVSLSVESGWRIPSDSVAEVRASGLLAAVTIDIRAGASTQALEPGGFIEGRAQRDLFGAVSDTANSVRQITESSVRPLIESLDRTVQALGSAVERDAGPLLADLRVVSGELAARAPVIIDQFLALATDVRELSGRLQAVLGDANVGHVDATLANLEQGSAYLVELAADTRAQLGALLGERTRERVDATLGDVARASGNVADLSSRLGEVLDERSVDRFRAALDNVGRAAGNVAGLSEELRGTGVKVHRLLATVDRTLADAEPEVRQGLGDLRYTLRILAEHVDAVAQNLEGTSRNMYELSRELRMNPARLLGGEPPVDTAVPPGGVSE